MSTSAFTRLQRLSERGSVVLMVPGALALLLGTAGCGRQSVAAPTADAGTTTLSVTTASPQRRTLHRTIEQPGWIEAYEQTPIYSRIAGYVGKVNVDIGAQVRQGDVLAELRVPELVEELHRKEAQVDQAEKALATARAQIATAAALVQEMLAGVPRAEGNYKRWQLEYERIAGLAKRKAIDEQTALETWNQLQAAASALKEAQAKIESARALQNESEAKRDKAEADVRVAQAEVRHAAAILEYTNIRAPFDGVVAKRHVDTGHFLQPPSASGSGHAEPLFLVVRTDLVRIFVDVPEADAVRVGHGAAAHIRIEVLDDQEFEGKVAGCSWALEPGQRTLRTEVDFPNPDGRLRPGMYAYASIAVEVPNVWTLPAAAILTRDDQAFCYCAENGKAVRTPVRIGARDGSAVQVLRKFAKASQPGAKGRWIELTGTEQIIQGNAGALTDGQVVRTSSENGEKAIQPSPAG